MYSNRASAIIRGGELYPDIYGSVIFYQLQNGVEVSFEIYNLPPFSRENGMVISPFGVHIHEGGSCEKGSRDNPFPETGMHFNPTSQPHGNHVGDFPVLIPTTHGAAYMNFFTDKFSISDIVGKTVVLHQSPDDYRTQPSGNSGKKIACGVIEYD